MSFDTFKNLVEYGDTALLYIGYDNMLPVVVTKGKTHQTKFGAIKHDKLVGQKYGSRQQCANGWIYIVHPTPELWTLSLPHRTQILYSTDISMIIFQLDLKPGSVVVEAGTGSGSLSHAFLRTIKPMGHLHTFEFHEERSIKAREEFSKHGLGPYVTVKHRDVCGDGFQHEHIADAVFLDLPKPWECIPSAKVVLKKEGGRLCSFSPCIEQVQRSHEAFVKEGFEDIVTMECVNRNFSVQYAKMLNINFDGELIERNLESKSNILTCEDSSMEDSLSSNIDFRITKNPSTPVEVKVEDKKARIVSNSSCFATPAAPTVNMQGHTGFLTFATLSSH